MELLPEITTADHEEAINMLRSGSKMSALLLKWKISEEDQQTLAASAL